MRLFEEIVTRFRVLFFGSKAAPQAAVPQEVAPQAVRWPAPASPRVMPATAAPVIAPEPVESSPRNRSAKAAAGKPATNAMSRTLDLLAKNPDINAAQLAATLKVSPSYARTLLRRARMSAPEVSPKELAPKPVELRAAQPDLHATIRQLASRLEETESNLARLRNAPPPAPAPAAVSNASLNRRSEVLRMKAEGQTAQSIASTLGIPTGEVEFIVKIDKMAAARA